jgi:hypothetical protein
LDTLERLLGGAGFELVAQPRITFTAVAGPRGREIAVPDYLPRLAPMDALATVRLPLRVNWSQPGRVYRLADRGERARVYELVLREGSAEDVARYIDGVLLIDLWPELVLPAYVRTAWTPVIDSILEPREQPAIAAVS